MINRDQAKDQVRERADLPSLVSKHTKLVKATRGYKACCPLPGHKEKTPSFHINSELNTYFCFGCQRGGDVFTFLEVMEGLSFREALEELAGQLHIELPKHKRTPTEVEAEKKAKSEKDYGFEILERAANFFHQYLTEEASGGAKKAADYLFERGISESEIRELKLGFSPEAGSVLTHKISKKEDFEIARKVGLIGQSEDQKRFYDFFRDRMMIPIQDHRGRVIGFSGRVLDPLSKTNKYVNSRESEWFKKKSVVYGLQRALPLIRENDFVCVVEGYFDQWALHRAEIPSVAVMGVALTEEHLALIARYTKKIILVMDADAAGIASTHRSLPHLMKDDWQARVFTGFQGKDPDEWLKSHSISNEELKNRLLASPDGLEWLAKNVAKDAAAQKLGRMQIFEKLKDIWGFAQSEARKNLLADELAPLLGLEHHVIRESMDDLLARRGGQGQNPTYKSPNQEPENSFSGPSMTGRGFQSKLPSRKLSSQSAFERSTEELFVWWVRHIEKIGPKNSTQWKEHLQIFENTVVFSWVEAFHSKNRSVDTSPTLALVSEFLLQFDQEAHPAFVRDWILKGLVEPENQEKVQLESLEKSFQELAAHLNSEKVKIEINRLQNELRDLKADRLSTARILQTIQDLRNNLEKSK